MGHSDSNDGEVMARTVKVYRISDDGRRVAAGAFRVNSESDLQTKWELHLATAGSGLYIATHRGIQLGVGLAILARRRSSRGMAVASSARQMFL